MGAADVVPGVSGGTIAFITGIYEELINSLRRIDHKAAMCLWRQGPKAAWQHINGTFLVLVFGGVLVSIFSLAKMITLVLELYPILVWSFFFGLVFASGLHLWRTLGVKQWNVWFFLVLGVSIALAVSLARPTNLPDEWWMVFIAGSIAICAMILPGISGSFILVLMGMYSVFLKALSQFDLLLLGSFGAGCVVGLLAFSHLLNWLLEKYHAQTLAILTGFLLGSLNIIWPWKEVITTRVNRHGEEVPLIQNNVLPWTYEQIYSIDAHLGLSIGVAIGGVLLVLGVEWCFAFSSARKENVNGKVGISS